jgi:hypothetical protein
MKEDLKFSKTPCVMEALIPRCETFLLGRKQDTSTFIYIIQAFLTLSGHYIFASFSF